MNDNVCACEAKRPATICATVTQNRELIADINVGMDRLLDLLIGPQNGECGNVKVQPDCLQDDVNAQHSTLGQIYDKLNRVLSVLNG